MLSLEQQWTEEQNLNQSEGDCSSAPHQPFLSGAPHGAEREGDHPFGSQISRMNPGIQQGVRCIDCAQILICLFRCLTDCFFADLQKEANCWEGCGERGTSTDCWWEYRLVHDLGKEIIWQCLSKFSMHMQCGTAMLLLQDWLLNFQHKDICTRERSASSSAYNGEKFQTIYITTGPLKQYATSRQWNTLWPLKRRIYGNDLERYIC